MTQTDKSENSPTGYQKLGKNALNKFTIITSVLNGQDLIESTINSVLDQKYINFEYIVIDGNSSDKTLEILNRYRHKITHIISEPDEGIYDAWNKALKLLSGNWMCFIGCGDLLAKDALNKYNDYIIHNPELEFISSRIELIDEKGEAIRIVGSPWRWNKFKKYMNTLHTGALHHRSLFEKHGYFNKEFKIAGDYEMLLRAQNNLNAGFLNAVTIKMRIGGVSVSDISVFDEVEKAKLMHTKKSKYVCRVEKYIDIIKLYTKLFINKYLGIRYI